MTVEVVIPVYNEERRLARCLPRLHRFLDDALQHPHWITIANNGSTDATQALGESFAKQYTGVQIVGLPDKGRGGALKATWHNSGADVLSYMDVDLSADLGMFPNLIEMITSGGFDVAIGSRFLPKSNIQRSWKRQIISTVYMRLVRFMHGTSLSDMQCGFKALSQKAARTLLPMVEDMGWFFDTELLLLAERLDYKVFEQPVVWREDTDSRVNVIRTAWADLRGNFRVRKKLRSLAGAGRNPAGAKS